MKSFIKKLTLSSVALFAFTTMNAQLTVAAGTPTQLVDTLLGLGVTASGITYSGYPFSTGTFNGVFSNIGFNAGAFLCTGDINMAPGPNISSSSSLGGSMVLCTDPELNAIATATLYDAAILEFDFVPMSDTLKFRYVFASEEYPEFVCSNFNDVFGFFISGPNPAGGSYVNQNIAIIPGSGGLPVAINTVNPGVVGSAGTPGGCTSLAYSSFYFDNESPPGATVEFDGFTIPLTALAAVTCGQTYHIKLALADAGDGSWDSGVFLEAGSFSSQGVAIIPEISYGAPDDSTLYEGCGLACIYFVRTTNLANADTVNVTIGGSAVNGLDYNTGILGVPLPSQLFFAAGQDSISYCINAVSDALIEGLDTILLEISTPTPCGPLITSAIIYLSEFDSLSVVTSADTSICPGSITINGLVTGGVEPYIYSWSGGAASISSPTVSPAITTTYYLTVSDACNNTIDPTPNVSDSVLLTVLPAPVMTINTQIAAANDSTLFEGCMSACIYFIRTSPLIVADTFNITIGGTGINGTDYSVVGTGLALPNQIVFPVGVDSIQYCIDATLDGIEGTETILLDVVQGMICPQPLSFANLYIQDITPLSVVTSGDTTICGSGSTTITGLVTGGVEPYTYTWSGGAASISSPTVNPASTTTYFLTVSDACTNTIDPTPNVSDSVLVTIIPAPVMIINTQIAAVNDSTLFEGCTPACFYFIRTSPLTVADTFNITIGGTATNGTDYTVTPGSTSLPSQIIFPVGVDSVQYCISAGIDAIEGIETILLDVIQGAVCPQPISFANLFVQDVTPISIITSGDSVFCSGGGVASVNVIATGGLQPYTYTWSGGLPSTPSSTITVTSTTTYTVTVNDACPSSTPAAVDSVTISVVTFPPMVANAGSDMLVCPGDLINLNATITGGGSPYTYLWQTISGTDSVSSPSNASTTLVANGSGVYQVLIIDTCGNVQTDQVIVDVESSCVLNIPNIITPDGTGPAVNEFFYVENLEKFPGSSLAIYNRWGTKVFESSDYQNNWNGSKAVDGVYYYVLTVPAAGTILASANPSPSFKATEEGENKVFAGYFHITRMK